MLHIPYYTYEDNILLRINRAGFVKETPTDFHIRRDSSYKYNVIHCVTQGQGTVLFRNKQYTLEKGDLFILPHGEAHEYFSNPESPLGLCWIEFFGSNSNDAVRQILSGNAVYKGKTYDEVLQLCSEIIMRLEKLGHFGDISILLHKILVELLRASGYMGFHDIHREGFSEILNYIDDNLDKQLTIEILAAQLGYNATYFARKFADTFGTPPAQYIVQQRIIHSKKLLMSSNKSIEQIAEESGFYDTSHFVAKFKSYEGVTPLNYRKQNKGLVLEGEKK